MAGSKESALRLIEAVALVQHQIGALAVHFQIVPRGIHRFFHVRHARIDGVELDKVPVRAERDDIGERRLAAAGGPQKIQLPSLSVAMARRSRECSETICFCPINSSRLLARILSASGFAVSSLLLKSNKSINSSNRK